jgi:mxaJ protein
MFSPCRRPSRYAAASIALLGTVLVWALVESTPAQQVRPPEQKGRILRVAADPNNLPFSNDRGEGFENKIAQLIAEDLHANLQYQWHAQRRGFFRETLKQKNADLVMGVPAGFGMALTTDPYYASTYTFVFRRDRVHEIHSLDDPELRKIRIGVQLVGNDGVNTPPVHALSARGIVDNVVGYTLYGDYAQENPPARIVHAVANNDVDIALVWGPLAGYFVKREAVPLKIVALTPKIDSSGFPFVFSIAMGVRKGDAALQRELNEILKRRKCDIDKILSAYGVPLCALPETVAGK